MHFFALPQDCVLESSSVRRHYRGVTDAQAPPVQDLYLALGDEVRQLTEKLHACAAPAQPALQFIHETALHGWAPFPTRLGRMSCRMGEAGLHLHQEAEPLPAQLQALRAKKPLQQHFRIAIVNAFGSNLGDCTMGATALRVIMQHLRQHLPSVSCDALFGVVAGGAASALILQGESGIERALFETMTAPEFAQYDAYFDFDQLLNLPLFGQLPTVDWLLWWCGLAPETVPAEHKRNRGHIRQEAWQAVQALLRPWAGQKVLFNPKASVPLRSMPEGVALQFAQHLLEIDSEIRLVIDQPMACKHPRLIDLSGQIDSPEKLKALVGQMDGVITVDTFALHQADISATPCVTLCSSIAPSFYPYYPHNAAIGIPGYDSLPAYRRSKVSDAEWVAYKSPYHAAWASLDPAEVLKLLRTKIAEKMADALAPKVAQPQVHPDALPSLTIGPSLPPASCEVQEGRVPRLKRQRLAPEHAWVSQRFAVLAKQLVQPGSIAVMACAPDAELALTVAERIAPHGELIVLEPRAPLARHVEAALHLAGAPCTARVLQAVSLGGALHATVNVLEPWSESHSHAWGNLPAVTTVPSQPVDALALAHCSALLVQSPMPCALFITGALETLQRCRPFLLMAPVGRQEAAAVLQAAQAAHYDFWMEAALPSAAVSASIPSASTWLLVGVPRERSVRMAGFTQLRLE